jgi:hypothetical protein
LKIGITEVYSIPWFYSILSNPPASPEDVFSTLHQDRVVNILTDELPSGVDAVKTPGTTGNPIQEYMVSTAFTSHIEVLLQGMDNIDTALQL